MLIALSAAVTGIGVSLVLASQARAEPDVKGKSFSDAQATLSQAGYKAVVSTLFGARVSQGDCIVVRQQTTLGSPFLGSAGGGDMVNPSGEKRVLLSLDCDPRPK